VSTSEAPWCRDETVVIVGGGKSASRTSPTIEVHTLSRVVEVEGDDRLRAVKVAYGATGETYRLPVDGLFICTGGEPRTDWVVELDILKDRWGYVSHWRGHGPARPSRWPLGRDPFPLETISSGAVRGR
jgi:hypothetical protein